MFGLGTFYHFQLDAVLFPGFPHCLYLNVIDKDAPNRIYHLNIDLVRKGDLSPPINSVPQTITFRIRACSVPCDYNQRTWGNCPEYPGSTPVPGEGYVAYSTWAAKLRIALTTTVQFPHRSQQRDQLPSEYLLYPVPSGFDQSLRGRAERARAAIDAKNTKAAAAKRPLCQMPYHSLPSRRPERVRSTPEDQVA